METDEKRKDYKQEKSHSLSIHMPLKLTRTKRGWNGERREERQSTSSNTHAWQEMRYQKK
jgi:hypothetical protein